MRNWFWLLVAGLLFLPAANAAEFQMRDNSIVFGSILRLVDGKDLVVDTAHMGEVTLEWEALKQIHDTRIVEVEYFDGNRVIGSILLENGVLIISGDKVMEISPSEVYAISEVKSGFWDALGVYTNIGLNIVRGNSRVTQLNSGAGVSYDVPGMELSIDAATFSNEQVDSKDARRTTLSANYTSYLQRKWSLTGLFDFESDEQSGLNSRSVVGAAVGKRILNSRAQRLGVFAGLALNSEDLVNTPDDEISEALLGMRYQLRSRGDVDATILYFQNTEASDQYRVQFDATLTMDLVGDFDLNISAYDRYDSDPPAETGKNDYGLVLASQWSK